MKGKNEKEKKCERNMERYRNSVGIVFLQKLEEESASEWNTKEILPVRFSPST